MSPKIRRILCATDFSEVSRMLVPYSIDLAAELNAELYVCHVIDLPTISIYGEAVFDPITQQQRFTDFAYREIENELQGASVKASPIVTMGHATEEITRLAADYEIDLVVAATRGRTGLRRLFLGSVTARLMHTLNCPLLVLRTIEELSKPKRQALPFRRILVGCDFSKYSRAAFECGLNMAQEFESELHLVHVVEPTGYKELLKISSDSGEQIDEGFQDAIKEKLKAKVPQEAMNWCEKVETEVLVGRPFAELTSYADENDIDLIVLGVRGHGMVENLMVGSTTDRVVRGAPCPVLSVYLGPEEE
ncbi:MAG: universal stress protein [Desulfobacteraceae bacterium]|nr:universal stress protein [Desulfobacteraceae bacterium]